MARLVPEKAIFTVTGAARTWTVSLLDAALHNFEAGEAFEAQSGFITQPRHDGQFEPLPTLDARISVAQFTALCRELDIGGRYQHYLDQFFDARNAVAVTRLRLKLDTTHKADLAVALQIAWMKKDLLDDQSFVLRAKSQVWPLGLKGQVQTAGHKHQEQVTRAARLAY